VTRRRAPGRLPAPSRTRQAGPQPTTPSVRRGEDGRGAPRQDPPRGVEAIPRIDAGLLKRVARSHNLTDEQYARIVRVLGRQPTVTEVGIFGVMYSEHCSYCSSRMYLKQFPTKGPRILVPAGKENAGLVDIGDGLAVAFKIESHNHPSAVEPHAGAATGVGGILRDIFTMGARPIALLDSLRFGPLTNARTRFLMDGVVRGIADYGNCLAGDEQVIIRNSGKVKSVPIGSYVDFHFDRQSDKEQCQPAHPIEVLSFDATTQQSRWCQVTRLWRRRATQMLKIKTTMGRSWLVTPEHPSIVCERGELVAKPASTLKPGDEIPIVMELPQDRIPAHVDLIPLCAGSGANIYVRLRKPFHAGRKQIQAVLHGVEPSASNRCRYLGRRRMPLQVYLALEQAFGYDRVHVELFIPSGKSNYIGCQIPLSKDFARLVGYYLAEGCLSRNGTTYKLIWVFGRSRADAYYIADLRRILRRLRWRHSVEQRASTVAITVSSWFLGTLLKDIWHCGDRAHTKSIPDLFFKAPRPVRLELLKGLWRGDGSVSIRKAGFRVKLSLGTASSVLANQVTLLLQDLGIVPLYYSYNRRPSMIRGRFLKSRVLHHVELNGYQPVHLMRTWFAPLTNARIRRALRSYQFPDLRWSFPRYRRDGSLGFLRVTSVAPEPYNSTVYDFEVEKTHLFVATGGLLTHNCVGVPTVGGEIVFDPCYQDNPLVNVMCIGVVPAHQIARSAARGPGNPVIYVGSSTGRDGLGGASFASRELSDASEEDRPAVQIGDPFAEKCLIEATLEALATGGIVGIQDMGAAGLTCSSAEMPARGRTGMEIELARVPRRETGMTPHDIMLSESQERMLLVARRGGVPRITRIFDRWGLNAVEIGRVTSGERLRVLDQGEVVAEIPVRALTEEAPVYRRPIKRPRYLAHAQRLSLSSVRQPTDHAGVLLKLLASPTIASKAAVYEQYDHMVQTNTVALPGLADAAVLRLKGTSRLLAATTDGNGRYCYLDPQEGGKLAVTEAARNLVCVGAQPLAITNCLNFGNPQDPEIMWQFKECVRGISEACRAFGTPVTGGNVSFYNEGPRGAIDPTPVIGMIGVSDARAPITANFKDEGDVIVLLGDVKEELGGSAYLAVIHGRKAGRPPRVNLAQERALQRVMLEAAQHGWLKSAHDCSDGGFAVALAECCIVHADRLLGAVLKLETRNSKLRPDVLLFGESAGRIVLTCERFYLEAVSALAKRHDVTTTVLGTVGGRHLRIAPWIDLPVEELSAAWRTGLPCALER